LTDIFLSYSREDQIVARRFAGGFEREGLSVWWDQSLTPGEAFDQVTERALGEAKAVIVLWSKSSVNSRWVRAEATQANADHRLVPVMIEHCKRPIMFELTHTAELSEWQGNIEDPEWQSFVANVRQFVQHPIADTPTVTRTPRRVGPSLSSRGVTALKRVLRFGVGIALAIVLAAIAAGIAWKLRSPADHEITRFAVDLAAPLETMESLALSPDGRRIVYAIARQLYSRRLDQDQPTPIPGATDAQNPFFSPDGKSVAFFTSTQLKAFDFGSEAIRVIADVKPAPGLVGNWDPEGRIYFGLGGAFGLSWVPAVGGVPEPFAKLAKYADLDYPDVLPGGKWVLFSADIASADWSGSDIVAQNIATGERKIVLKGGHFARYLSAGYLLFARGGTLYAIAFDARNVATRGRAVPVVQGVATNEFSGHAQYAVAANGTLVYAPGGPTGSGGATKSVVRVSRSGEPTNLSADPRAYSNPRISPDGSRIAVEVGGADKTVHIWTMDAAGAAAQLTFDGEENRYPVWTPDGREILFTSKRGKEFSIYRKAADGTDEARRVLGGTPDIAPSDVHGHTLIYQDKGGGGGRDIFTLDLEAGGPSRPLLATPADETGARVSPSGKWMVYLSATATGSAPDPKIYVRPYPDAAGGQRAISEGFGYNPVWSPTGDEIYFIEYGTSLAALVSVPVSVTPTTLTPAGRKELFVFVPRFDATIGGSRNRRSFDVFPKGGFVAVNLSAPKPQDGTTGSANRPRINVVLNWLEELRRLAPVE
jgi:Tol biopolymer transport system component